MNSASTQRVRLRTLFLASASMMALLYHTAHAQEINANGNDEALSLTAPVSNTSSSRSDSYAQRHSTYSFGGRYASPSRQKPLAPVKILLAPEDASMQMSPTAPLPASVSAQAIEPIASPEASSAALEGPGVPVNSPAASAETTQTASSSLPPTTPPVTSAPQTVTVAVTPSPLSLAHTPQAMPPEYATPVAVTPSPTELAQASLPALAPAAAPSSLPPIAARTAELQTPVSDITPPTAPHETMHSVIPPASGGTTPGDGQITYVSPAPVPLSSTPVIEDEGQSIPAPPITHVITTPAAAAAILPDNPATLSPSVAATIVPTTPVTLPPQLATALDTVDPVQTLSPETKAILSHLPSHLGESKHKEEKKKITVSRVNSAVDVFGNEEFKETEAVGVKIEVKAPPPDVNHELEVAYEALVGGQTEEAIGLYQRALDAQPGNTLALFGLATTYHRLGQLDKARPLYGKLLAIDPTNKEGLTNFLALVAEESPNEALTELQKLELRNPGFSPIPAQIGLIYKKLGQLDKAEENMAQAVSLSPDNLVYQYNLAVILDKMGHSQEAAVLYTQLLADSEKGASIPGSIQQIQERLTFIRSN